MLLGLSPCHHLGQEQLSLNVKTWSHRKPTRHCWRKFNRKMFTGEMRKGRWTKYFHKLPAFHVKQIFRQLYNTCKLCNCEQI